MNTKHLALLLGFTLLFSVVADRTRADTILLKSGEKFTSDKVWEENEAIRFNMHGLIVKVNKQDVASIVHDEEGGTHSSPPLSARQPAPPVADPTLPPYDAQPVPDPASSMKPPPPARPEKHPATQTATGGTGLKGLSWQMAPEQIPGLVPIETNYDAEGIDHYIRPGEALRLGNARLDGIVYGFRKKRLYSIMYWVAGPRGYAALKQVVNDHYGSGTKSERGLERYIWRSTDTDRMLEFDKKLNTGIFWMRSRTLDDQLKEQSS